MIKFTKMHALGNDFMVINQLTESISLTNLPIPLLANRFLGVGFDQLLVIDRSAKADFFCHIFNSDGSEAAQCGNGLRCIARYLHETGLIQQKKMSIETKSGIYPILIHDYENITISMGAPTITHELITLPLPDKTERLATILSLGNSHTIIKVEELAFQPLNKIAELITHHPLFANGTNLGLMEIQSKHHIKLRTYERGAGETLACGSNACAAAVAGLINQWLAEKVQVEFRYGSLWVEWDSFSHVVRLSGPANQIYQGKISI